MKDRPRARTANTEATNASSLSVPSPQKRFECCTTVTSPPILSLSIRRNWQPAASPYDTYKRRWTVTSLRRGWTIELILPVNCSPHTTFTCCIVVRCTVLYGVRASERFSIDMGSFGVARVHAVDALQLLSFVVLPSADSVDPVPSCRML